MDQSLHCRLLCVYKRCHLVQKAQTENPEWCLQFLHSPSVLGSPPCDPVSCHYSFFCVVVIVFLLISFAYSYENSTGPCTYSQIHTTMLFQYYFFLFFFLKQGFYCFLTHPGVYLIPFSVHKCHF